MLKSLQFNQFSIYTADGTVFGRFENSPRNTHSFECECSAEVLFVYSLQHSLDVSVRSVQDQNPFTCRRLETRWRGADIEVFQPPVVDQQPGTVWVFKCVCKVVGMKKYPFKRSLWFTWCRYDRLHMILVQLQFVSWVDHLHHRCVFVSHLLRQQTITAIIDTSLTSTHSHDK